MKVMLAVEWQRGQGGDSGWVDMDAPSDQLDVGQGRELSVLPGQVCVGHVDVDHCLQGEDVAAVEDVEAAEGVPEQVRPAFWRTYAGSS